MDQILNIANTDVLIVVGETRIDVLGDAFKKSKKTFIPGPIDGARPQEEESTQMRVG